MHIRRITSYDDLQGIEALQTAVWQFEPMAVTPRHVFIAAIRSGGLVLGAFDEQDTFIGFALAFQGERNNRPCLYSHLVGILPSMQSQGVGYDLKMQQRKYGLELGFESIIWTFDPLLAKNAREVCGLHALPLLRVHAAGLPLLRLLASIGRPQGERGGRVCGAARECKRRTSCVQKRFMYSWLMTQTSTEVPK